MGLASNTIINKERKNTSVTESGKRSLLNGNCVLFTKEMLEKEWVLLVIKS